MVMSYPTLAIGKMSNKMAADSFESLIEFGL
jgi:hypothetical protein